MFQILTTEFGLSVQWDGKNRANIKLPYQYWNNTCGLCGTLNDDAGDDFTTPDGGLVSSIL